MSEKLKDYQVLDVFCGGTFYKVRHKVTECIFAWKAYDCRAYSDEQIQNIVNEVKTISGASADGLMQYYDTILHGPTKILYLVLEYNSWRSLQDLLEECKVTERCVAEDFVWRLLHDLARMCKAIAHVNVQIMRKCITLASVFLSDTGDLRVNYFELTPPAVPADLMRQIGELIRAICYRPGTSDDEMKQFRYSNDLGDIITFLTGDRSSTLGPDVVLYHPTVLTHIETTSRPKRLSDILVSAEFPLLSSNLNKCDSEKVVELCKCVEPLPRTIFNIADSPIYNNISPKRYLNSEIKDAKTSQDSLSPTLAALALELPGYVPRSRKPLSETLEPYNRPQYVSEQTFSQEWMARLVALRQREDSLNKREKNIIAKEIISSPAAKVIASDVVCGDSNGITLPLMLAQANDERREWVSRRRRRSGSVRSRPRRKSYAYEDLDSSLSADAGDGSVIITATKFTKENMPRRNIFPEVATKKVHFTTANPFTESDESVTLTFYELENMDKDGYQVPIKNTLHKDIGKFKYLDVDKVASEKRCAVNWSHSSPSKQAKITKNVFNDISNHSSIRKTPSKTSLLSRGSDCSRFSMMSAKSHWSTDSSVSQMSDGGVFERTRSSIRQSIAQTPIAPDMKKKSRKSLITFKTPFKFMSSAK